MGLESYKDKVNSSSSTVQNNSNKQQSNSNKSGDDEKDGEKYFKVVPCTSERKKIFRTEEEWDETVEFIETNFGLDIDEVMNMGARKRHDILHQGVLKKDEEQSTSFYPIRKCIVCDETFVFPNNWKFSKYEGEAVCGHHTIKEARKAFEDMNELES